MCVLLEAATYIMLLTTIELGGANQENPSVRPSAQCDDFE